MYITILNAAERFLFVLISVQNKALRPQSGPVSGVHPHFNCPNLFSRCRASVFPIAFQIPFLPTPACPSPADLSCLDAPSSSF